jgi:malonate-semialdehyde dehydrogenase (acetylating)/methylmalonate-semialdehyde dehydrogenase
MQTVPLLIDGEFLQSKSNDLIAVTNPANNAVIANAPKALDSEMEAAISAAASAFETWKKVPTPERARVMMRYQHLLKEHHDELATILASETGKTFDDAKGDVWRGIEVVEQAMNIPALMMGETVENVARNIDTYSYIQQWPVPAETHLYLNLQNKIL